MTRSLRITAVNTSFLALPGATSVVEGAQNRIVAGGDQDRHGEHRAHRRSAAVDRAATFHQAAVARERLDAGQRRRRAGVALAELRQWASSVAPSRFRHPAPRPAPPRAPATAGGC